MGKDDRTTLAAQFIWALIVHRRGIVQLPENVQQIVVRNSRRIVAHFDHFYVSGRVGTYIVVCRIVYRAAHISNAGSSDARELAEDLLNAQKQPAPNVACLMVNPSQTSLKCTRILSDTLVAVQLVEGWQDARSGHSVVSEGP